MNQKTIYEHIRQQGYSRRDFLAMCTALAGTMGFGLVPPLRANGDDTGTIQVDGLSKLVANALENRPRLPIIWLEMQDCAGCTEAFTRSQSPTAVDLVLNQIAIEYHETLSAAAGFQIEQNKQAIMEEFRGQYLLVVEGSVPTADGGVYCTIGGRTALDHLHEAADGAAAVIAVGNCAAFGGIPKADPNPTAARGIGEVLPANKVVNVPGCPAIPEVITGLITYFIVSGKMPGLDELNRPKNYYGRTIHDRCLRRPFFDAGQFAGSFDDHGAKNGWCLFLLGCKGPTTHNSCAKLKWGKGLSFPIESGHPCLGCSEPDFWDAGGFYEETRKYYRTYTPLVAKPGDES